MTARSATLVTGGAGYIGSHYLLERGPDAGRVVVFDSLVNGHEAAVPAWAEFVQGDLTRPEDLRRLFEAYDIQHVIHFAALAEVGQSMADPMLYYRNNVLGGQNLLEACLRAKTKSFIFSSTTATYGEPEAMPISEDCPQAPVNPYGESKWMMERMLLAAQRVSKMRVGILRYFNVAGADPEGRAGEDHRPESHLIPSLLLSLLHEAREFTLHGDDYPTPDGTCVRDYVHVSDLAQAHVLLGRALRENERLIYNVGSGSGYSVREILAAVERVTGRKVPVRTGPRRPGDPPLLVADSARIRRELQWQPRHGLDTMIATAWRWHSVHPHGYGAGHAKGDGGGMHPRRLFGEICVEIGVASRKDVDKALAVQEQLRKDGKQHKMIGLIMHEQQMLSNDDLIRVLKEMDIRNKLTKAE